MKKERIIALLWGISETAGGASLTGALEKSNRILVKYYNNCLDAAKEGLMEDESLFEKAEEDQNMDEIGAQAKLLLHYLNYNE